MILGYKKLKDCEPGQLVRLRWGVYLLLSEYRSGNGTTLDAYISGSGENFAAGDKYADEWVAIIDLDWIEVNLEDELNYPDVNTVTISPEAKKRLMDEYGLTEDDFIQP